MSYDTTMVDIFGEYHPTKYFLLHEYHSYWDYLGNELDDIVNEAVELYPDEDDFDKAYYFSECKINETVKRKRKKL